MNCFLLANPGANLRCGLFRPLSLTCFRPLTNLTQLFLSCFPILAASESNGLQRAARHCPLELWEGRGTGLLEEVELKSLVCLVPSSGLLPTLWPSFPFLSF